MNSFNHYAYGAIGEWLYRHVAGIDIDPAQPGYKHILLAPHPGGGLNQVKSEISTLYGKVSSAWKFDNEDFVYEIEIPANTTATVTLPYAKPSLVKVNGLPLTASPVQGKDAIQINLGSGKYNLTYPGQSLKEAVAVKIAKK